MEDLFKPAGPPKSKLGVYRQLSPTAGVRVSPLCLGAMSIGEKWSNVMGSLNKEQAFELLDAFVDMGGNFIDTASNYQSEDSEKWIGEWMKERGNRDLIVLATKFTAQYRAWELGKGKTVNFQGNSRKTMHMSVRDSLKKLQTDYIDLLYVHWWDYSTSIPELMDGLHALVLSGKVLYLGISDTPAWIVAACNTYAMQSHQTPFSVYQGRWSVLQRSVEHDIVPMCRHFGMALTAWEVVGAGKLQTRTQMEERRKNGEKLRSLHGADQTEDEQRMSEALEKVATELKASGQGDFSIAAIAIAFIIRRTRYCFPILGGRKVDHLKDNVTAFDIELSDEQVKHLEDVVQIEKPFPISILGHDQHETGENGFQHASTAHIKWQTNGKPI